MAVHNAQTVCPVCQSTFELDEQQLEAFIAHKPKVILLCSPACQAKWLYASRGARLVTRQSVPMRCKQPLVQINRW